MAAAIYGIRVNEVTSLSGKSFSVQNQVIYPFIGKPERGRITASRNQAGAINKMTKTWRSYRPTFQDIENPHKT